MISTVYKQLSRAHRSFCSGRINYQELRNTLNKVRASSGLNPLTIDQIECLALVNAEDKFYRPLTIQERLEKKRLLKKLRP